MRILLIGGNGFIGSWLAYYLTKHLNHEVLIVDNRHYLTDYAIEFRRKVSSFKIRELTNKSTVLTQNFLTSGDRVFKEFSPEAVVHLAALPLEKPLENITSQKQLTDDMELTYKAVLLAKQYDVKKFLFMSSLFAYGDHEYGSTEDRQLNPKTPYGIAKAAGEFLIKSYLDHWKIVRTTSIYGFGDVNNRVTQVVINRALKGQPFWINNEALLDFVYIKDLVRGIGDFLVSDIDKEAIHISGGKALTIKNFVDEVSKYVSDLKYETRKLDDRPKRGTLDNTKARVLLNWSPEFDLEEGVKDYFYYINKYGFA